MPAHDKFKARKLAVEREILTPAFPDDVIHLEDGTWSCSPASFEVMSRSFARFGFTLDYQWSFDTLYEKLTFILEAAGKVSLVGMVALNGYSPAMHAYLLAVKNRDDTQIRPTLSRVLAELIPTEPPVDAKIRKKPQLILVK